MPSPRRSLQSGFTLIELIAVIGVLGMVLFFVLPNLDNISPRAKLHSHARRLASTIELAQGEAAGTGKEFVLAYDLTKGSYWVILPAPDPSPSPTPSPHAPAPQTSANGSSTSQQNQDVQIPTEDAEHGLTPDLSSEQTGGGNGSSTTNTTNTSTSNKSSTGSSSSTSGRQGTTSSNSSTQNVSQRDTLPAEDLPDEVMIQSVTPLNGRQAESGMIYIPFSALGDEGSHIVVLGLKRHDGNNSSEPPISIRFNALTRTVDFSNEKIGWQSISGN